MEADAPQDRAYCKATKKDGKPCGMFPGGIVTPGYCFGHDPGITPEMRSGFAKGRFQVPNLAGRRRLKTIEDVKRWAEDKINHIEINFDTDKIEVVEVQVQVMRLFLTALREENVKAGKKTSNAPKSSWKGVG